VTTQEDVLSAQDATEIVLRHIGDLTTKDTLGAVSAEPIEDGWVVGVEIVELPRIPSTSDIIALYEAEVDLAGNLLAYRRIRRYTRGRTE
jgi:hypothetical protein